MEDKPGTLKPLFTNKCTIVSGRNINKQKQKLQLHQVCLHKKWTAACGRNVNEEMGVPGVSSSVFLIMRSQISNSKNYFNYLDLRNLRDC